MKSLKAKLVVLMLLVAFGPLMLIAGYVVMQQKQPGESVVRDDIEGKCVLAGAEIESFFDARKQEVMTLSQSQVLRSADKQAVDDYLNDALEGHAMLSGICIVERSGMIIAASRVTNEKYIDEVIAPAVDMFEQTHFALKNDVCMTEAVLIDKDRLGVVLLTPVTNEHNNQVVRTLVATVSLDTVVEVMKEIDGQIAGDRYSYLIDSQGRVLATADEGVEGLGVWPGHETSEMNPGEDHGRWMYTEDGGEQVEVGHAVVTKSDTTGEHWKLVASTTVGEFVAADDEHALALIAGALGCLLVTGVCVLLAVRWVVRPVMAMAGSMRAIVEGGGDLSGRVDESRNDELGEVGKWFNFLMGKIQDVVGRVDNTAAEVVGVTQTINSTNNEIAQGIGAQSSQTTQVASAMEQMKATVVEVARKSMEAAESAEQAGKAAEAGGEAVTQTIEGIQAIAESTGATEQAIGELGEQSKQIGKLIEVINDIADQTNLLALNAAIEAARAGDAGRGFAVVADEVRKLADRTTAATGEVAQSVKAIQNGTQQATEHMNDGREKVEQGVALAEQAGDALQSILDRSGEVSGMIQAIAAAVEEQSAATEEISRSIESINEVTQQSAMGSDHAVSATAELSGKTDELRQLVREIASNKS